MRVVIWTKWWRSSITSPMIAAFSPSGCWRISCSSSFVVLCSRSANWLTISENRFTVGWLCRFAAFWFFLDAFHIGGSLENVLIVMSVESVAKALPFTPGGAGAQQALLVATLAGPSVGAVLSFSVGQGLAVAVLAIVLGFASMAAVFRTTDWRTLLREGRAAQAGAGR